MKVVGAGPRRLCVAGEFVKVALADSCVGITVALAEGHCCGQSKWRTVALGGRSRWRKVVLADGRVGRTVALVGGRVGGWLHLLDSVGGRSFFMSSFSRQ